MGDRYRVNNWKSYNENLKRRGNIFIFFSEECFGKEKRKGRGSSVLYKDELIILFHQIKYMYGLAYRQTEGFIEGLREKGVIGNFKVPNYSTMCRRIKKLNIKINDYRKNKGEEIMLAIDSTGVSIYNMSDWHKKMNKEARKYKGIKTYRKLHIMMDLESRMIIDAKLTEAEGKGTGDLTVGKEFINRSEYKIKKIIADGAYGNPELHRIAHAKGIREKILPPAKNRHYHKLGLKTYDDYNEAISFIKDKEKSLKLWKEIRGYYKRSRIEACIGSFKRILGGHLSAKSEDSRVNEIMIKLNILNYFRSFTPLICSKI